MRFASGSPLTVVVATYNRPEVLKLTLRCLISQTFQNWVAFVIGDCCDEATSVAVHEVGESRIWYFNLPKRCGDQSGPNSIGARLSRSEYLAFLNHDDLLLKDHFELCLNRLRDSNADFCVGRVARATHWTDQSSHHNLLYRVQPLPRLNLAHLVLAPDAYNFEPISAWVMRTAAYARVGDWKDGANLYRTPMNDWFLRASYEGLRCCHIDAITTIRMLTQYAQQRGQLVYRASPVFHQQVVREMENRTAAEFRTFLSTRLEEKRGRLLVARTKWRSRQVTAWTRLAIIAARRCGLLLLRPLLPSLRQVLALFMQRTGRDPYDIWCRLLGRQRGWWKRCALKIRTGDRDLEPVNRLSLLDAARSAMESRA